VIEDVKIGEGRTAQVGDRLKMQYIGKLKSGKVFDASKKPFVFRLGRGEVIRGWDIGCVGMAVGGKRKLTIPPEKGYGKSGAPPTIPGNSTLLFDITLVGIQ
jgi:FK506-binding nuclear protein